MDVKYTDIDYLVFSDASRYVYEGLSPYQRETYRYTPLLAWILVPNNWHPLLYSWGKFLFIVCDLLTGLLIIKILKHLGASPKRTLILSSIWLLNPMVITISTRGSSESILTVLVISFAYSLIKGRYLTSGVLLGTAVHLKLYPIIYALPAIIHLDKGASFIDLPLLRLVTGQRVGFALFGAASFLTLTFAMYWVYGLEFLHESFIYHLTRSDHRHNFSLYNLPLYLRSDSFLKSLAFIPQMVLVCFLLPLTFGKRNILATFFIQTFVFVAYNKVITSQYFIWYLCLLPCFLKDTTMSMGSGICCVALWALSQAAWLFYAYKLEFLGNNTFSELFICNCIFFMGNVYLAGRFIDDTCARTKKEKTD